MAKDAFLAVIINISKEFPMPNQDFPGVCFACCQDKDCNITPMDTDISVERVKALPEGYTKTLVKSLTHAFPDKFNDESEAYMVFDALKAVIANVLKNGDVMDLEGLGEFRVEPRDGRKHVIFTPERVLEDTVNE